MSENNTNELCHWGIKGMKWGVRRYQNKDGSLTPAGRRKAAKMKQQYAALTGKKLVRKSSSQNTSSQNKEDIHKRKNVSEMSDAELREKTNRLILENNYVNAINNYRNLNPKKLTRGQKFIKKVSNDVLIPAATEAGKKIVKDLLVNMLSKEEDNKKKKK